MKKTSFLQKNNRLKACFSERALTFCAALGIPAASIGSAAGGCSGICGSCQLSCAPGAAAVLLLAVKLLYKKLHSRQPNHVKEACKI